MAIPKEAQQGALWLAHYVILSWLRGFANLLNNDLAGRAVLEGGPPASISDAFQRLFVEKILETKLACQAARRKLNWPQRESASERSGRGEGFGEAARAGVPGSSAEAEMAA